MSSKFEELLERAQNHKTAEEAHEIIDKLLDLTTDNNISSSDTKKISRAINRRRKSLCNELKEKGILDNYFE